MAPHTAPAPTRLDRWFDEAIARDGLIAADDSILVGVSGGPDSVALLHLLSARAQRYRLHLGVAHLDHTLRPESGRDADFVRHMAVGLGLDVHMGKVDVAQMQRQLHLSLEEAARKARYDFFQRTATRQGYHKVALGHHADDNAETLLLHLLRGSGRLGLGGIRAIRQGVYIRPLIRVPRTEIESYLQTRELEYLTDRTNADSAMLRNRIRHRLIPLLESDYRPGVRTTLSRAAEVLAAEEDWIEGLLKPVFERLIADCRPGRLALTVAGLGELPLAAARRIVRSALRLACGDLGGIGLAHVEQIIRLSRSSGAAGPLHLPGNLRVQREQDQLVFVRQDPGLSFGAPRTFSVDYEYSLTQCGVLMIRETGDGIRISEVPRDAVADPKAADARSAFLDRDAVPFPLIIRNRRPGDRFYPLGACGSQKLKKFFGDHKVPLEERQRCPLLISNGRIIWVAGHRIDHQARISPLTRRVLKAEILVAKP